MLKISHHRWAGTLVIPLIILGLSGMAAGDELTEGQSLYAAKCQICHGAKPADFTNPTIWKNNPEEKIRRMVTYGKGVMPAFNLKDDEIKAIIDYMEHAFKK